MIQHVLIVDDTEINLILFGALVKKLENCEGHTFSSSLDALEWASSHPCDLLIVDYMMPDIDGLEFMARFKALPGCEGVPVLMITANDQKPLRYRALDLGANDFLIKPVDKVEFLARTKNMLMVSQARRQLTDHADWLAQEVRKATAEIVERERETVFRLCKAAEYRDPETGAHILRMAHYSMLNEPKWPVYAMTAAEWKAAADAGVRELPEPEAGAQEWQVWSCARSTSRGRSRRCPGE